MPTLTPAPARWSFRKALLLSPFRPISLLRRSDDLSVKETLLIHLLGAVMIFAAIIGLSAWAMSTDDGYAAIWNFIDWFFEHYEISAPSSMQIRLLLLVAAIAGVALTAIATVASAAVLATVTLAWAARYEPILHSYRRSITRWLIITPHITAMITAVVIVQIWLTKAVSLARASHHAYWQMEEEEWYIRHHESILVFLWCFAGMWLLFAIISGFNARRAIYQCRWPACCETCGYSLTGIRDDQMCPECGAPSSDSRSWDLRPGTAWDMRQQTGRLAAWMACLNTAIKPSTAGRRALLMSAGGGHAKLLFVMLGLIAISTPIGLHVTAFMTNPSYYRLYKIDLELVGVAALAVSQIGGWFIAASMAVSATIAGLISSWISGRNLLSLASQCSSHLMCLMVFWWIVFWITLGTLTFGINIINDIVKLNGTKIAIIFLSCILFVIVAGIIHFNIALWRYVMAARHANW